MPVISVSDGVWQAADNVHKFCVGRGRRPDPRPAALGLGKVQPRQCRWCTTRFLLTAAAAAGVRGDTNKAKQKLQNVPVKCRDTKAERSWKTVARILLAEISFLLNKRKHNLLFKGHLLLLFDLNSL